MTVNTENLAWQWAMDNITNDDVKTRTAAEHILTTTTPMTMADVEWDDKKHDMAGVITMRGTETVMIRLDMCTNWIVTLIGKVRRDQLIPNGKRYELHEITEITDKPEHPETLVYGYKDAPEGTIVGGHGSSLYVLREPNVWEDESNKMSPGEELEGTPRKVLRWGW